MHRAVARPSGTFIKSAAVSATPATTAASTVLSSGPAYRDPFYLDFDIAGHDATPEGDLLIRGFASTSNRDRTRDVILPTAFDESLPVFMGLAPTLLFNHDDNRPIGTVVEAQKLVRDDVSGLAVVCRVDSGEVDIIRKIQKKILRTFSIGTSWPCFDDIEFVEDELSGDITWVIKRLDLREVSIAPVPANPFAQFETLGKQLLAEYRKSAPTKPKSAAGPRQQEDSMKYTAEFKKSIGIDENATDEQVDTHLKSLTTRAAAHDSMKVDKEKAETEAFVKTWEDKLADDVIAEIKSLPNRDSLAEKLSKNVAAQATRPPIDNDAPAAGMAGTAAAAASTATKGGVTADDRAWREKMGIFEKDEDLSKAATMHPADVMNAFFGLKKGQRVALNPHDLQGYERRKSMFVAR